MRIWMLLSGDKSMWLEQVESNEVNVFYDFNGGTLEINKELQFKVIRKGENKDLPILYSGVPVLSDKSFDVLTELMSGKVQFLNANIINHEQKYTIANVTNVIDAIDHARSIPDFSVGCIVGFKKIAFIEKKVANQHIFKTPELTTSTVYVSDQFRETVLKAKLKGFDFIEVWDSEITEDMEKAAQDRYESFLAELDRSKGHEVNWSEAVQMINNGKAVANGHWKMQNDKNGVLQFARLGLDCQYEWSNSPYIPPILLGLLWHEVDKSEI
ncbi:imm11 family protein [Paenibacillus marinisediminis]